MTSRHAHLRVRAVFFDWFGTLAPLAPLDAACDEIAPGKGAKFAARWRLRQVEASWLRTITGRWADFDAVTAAAFDVTAAELGVRPGARAGARLVRSFLELPVRPGAPALLERLSASGMQVGVLSNGSRATLEAGIQRSGLGVDHVLSADSARRFKPDPAVYRLATDATRLTPPDIGFVTANGWDAAGASAFGFRVAWLAATGGAGLPAVDSPPPAIVGWEDVAAHFLDRR